MSYVCGMCKDVQEPTVSLQGGKRNESPPAGWCEFTLRDPAEGKVYHRVFCKDDTRRLKALLLSGGNPFQKETSDGRAG